MDVIETLPEPPGAVPIEEPVGAPHVDEEPRMIADGPGAWRYADERESRVESPESFDDSELERASEEDLHARWAAWEARHARNRLTLMVVVACVMAAVAGVWIFSLGDTIRSLTVSSSAASAARRSFLDQFAAYQQELNTITRTSLTNTGGTSTDAVASFVNALRINAARAAATTTAP